MALGALSYIFGGLMALGTSTGFCAATIFALRAGNLRVFELLLWGVFLFWQFFPLVFEGFSPGLSFSELARYPISLRLYVLLNAAYGLFDPAAVVCLLWLLSIWIGILVAHPQWALPAAFLFVIFAVLNVLCNRIVISVFERFQSTRRGRERVVAVLLILMLVPQFINLMLNGVVRVKSFHLPQWMLDVISSVRHVSPPGLVLGSLQPEASTVLFSLGLLAAYTALAAFVQVRQLRSTYLGEIYAETFRSTRDLKIKPGWKLPIVSESVSAIVEKELRYIRQNSRLLVTLVYPVLVFLFLLLGRRGMASRGFGGGAGMLGVFAGLVAISVSNMAYNTFGLDAEGFGRWLLSPLSLKKVLLAKNIAQGSLMTIIYLVGATSLLFFRHVSWDMLVAITAGFLALLILYLGAGNVISVYWPKRIDLTQMKSRMTSSAAGFASLLVMLPTGAIVGIIVLASWQLGLGWLPFVAAAVGLAASIKIYQWLSGWAVRHAEEHLEEIASQLGV